MIIIIIIKPEITIIEMKSCQVSIVAASSCRYLFWQRSALEYLLVKETYLATVLTTLVARDIATKLYAMNNKVFYKILTNLFIDFILQNVRKK